MTADTKERPLLRAFQLLRFLGDRPDTSARIPEICEHLGVHRVSAHRLVKALSVIGYVEQSADLSYHLGFEAWKLGICASKHFAPDSILDAIARLSEITTESVFVMRRAGLKGYCIASHQGAIPIRFQTMQVGSHRFLGIGGLSIAILSAMNPSDANRIVTENRGHYKKIGLTERRVLEQVERARKNGYGYSEGVIVPETRSLAVPVPTRNDQAAQLSVGILTTDARLLEPRRVQLAELLKKEASRLAHLF